MKVRITLELDESFLKMLKVSNTLGNVFEKDKLTAPQVLAIVTQGEGYGAHVEQTYSKIPHEWRDGIDIVSSERRWSKDDGKTWNNTGN